jgi:hypothetical protein
MKAFFAYSTIILIVLSLVVGCPGNTNRKSNKKSYSAGTATDQEDIDKFHEYRRTGR